MPRKPLKYIALIVVLLIVGHDGLMTGSAHDDGAASFASTTSVARSHHDVQSHGHEDDAEQRESDPESSCGTLTKAASPRFVGPNLSLPASLFVGPSDFAISIIAPVVRANEPDRLPGVQRAFLQVFLN